MKVIYLKVEVPDGFHVGSVNIIPDDENKKAWSRNIPCTEIHIPTYEEIREESYNVTDQAGNQLLVLDEVDVINLFSKLR